MCNSSVRDCFVPTADDEIYTYLGTVYLINFLPRPEGIKLGKLSPEA